MFLSHLNLKNFRNITHASLDFNPRFNFIFGQNAQGKTNLLEAIYYLGSLRSFRTSTLKDLLANDSEALIEGIVETPVGQHLVKINLNESKRTLTLNNKKPKLLSEYFGLLPVILFEPAEVYIFRESPSTRRRYLDRGLFLQEPETIRFVRDYEKVLAQKSKLLKTPSLSKATLLVYNEQLSDLGGKILYYRLKWIEEINKHLTHEYQKISGQTETATISYVSKIAFPEYDFSIQNCTELMLGKIMEQTPDEMERRECLVGPHRDDWRIDLGERNIATHGSQGENRSGIIALKLAQMKTYEERYKKPPVFLLDDVISELDSNRVDGLMSYLNETSGQVFVTTTDQSASLKITSQGSRFLVEAGRISII